MPENQGIYNIGKQEAGRDIFNIVIQHLATGKKVNLLSIQYALRKGETTKGNFFKKEPEWVDYEQGFIVERKEISEIIKNLENEKVQLVLGKPASGKSIILKNVGYKLANENKKIYIVELKKHQIEDVKLYFEAIPEINDDNPIFIVDDAHLYPSECEKLIRDFKSGGKGKLIMGSRPTEDVLPNHPKKTSEFQFLNKIEIHAENVTEEMIRTFLKKNHGFNDDRIKTVSSNLEKYRNDLWQLSWALNSYKPEKDSVDEEEIYENIMVSITKIETRDRKTINGEDVFLPLSVFYRFEIQVERDFLEEQLEIEEDILNQLIELSEIVETIERGNRMLSLHHSSLAELYFGAYQRYPSLGKRIKKVVLNGKDEKDELEYCSFYRYLTTAYLGNTIDAVISLDNDWSDAKNGRTLVNKLIEEEKIQEIIIKVIEKEEDMDKVRVFISIPRRNEEVARKLVKKIDINDLSSKINKEQDLDRIRTMLYIEFLYQGSGFKVVEMLDLTTLLSKIEKEEDLTKIAEFINSITMTNEEVGLKLIDSILSRIYNEDDLYKIGWCFDILLRRVSIL